MPNIRKEGKIGLLCYSLEMKEYISSLLGGEGYIVNTYYNSQQLISCVEEEEFDLIILDYNIQYNESNIELCKLIRNNFFTRYIPIIILIEDKYTMQRIKAIYAGADDYVKKPIQADELLTRIKAAIWRIQRSLDANPLTKLPGNTFIIKEVDRRLKEKVIFCVGYADLDKFKEYNDCYGFEWGDKLIKHTASLIFNALKDLGTDRDFLGHIGGDDFIFITSLDCIQDVCEKIIADFDRTAPSFYKEEDRIKGGIIVKNRQGLIAEIPIITISIGVATNKNIEITHSGQLIQLATELKQYAKHFSKSIYIIDRRQIQYPS